MPEEPASNAGSLVCFNPRGMTGPSLRVSKYRQHYALAVGWVAFGQAGDKSALIGLRL
jgi:hypothetical protein